MSDDIKYYGLGPEVVLGLKAVSDELGMPDDTVEFLKDCRNDIDEICQKIGKNPDSRYYETDVLFRECLENIKEYFDESIRVIEKSTEKCEDILRELDDVLYNQEYGEFFLEKYQNGVDI